MNRILSILAISSLFNIISVKAQKKDIAKLSAPENLERFSSCECSSKVTMDNRYGYIGDCKTYFYSKEEPWCYVKNPSTSTCKDLREEKNHHTFLH